MIFLRKYGYFTLHTKGSKRLAYATAPLMCAAAAGRRAAMVAKVPCSLTPRHPPSQVVDNLPRYAG